MATAASGHDNFHIDNHDQPPPAYELSDVELDRKIAAAAQRSLALTEQPQHGRPALPPIDEDGFPSWSDDLFEYNRQEREREEEQARDSKAQSEYRSSVEHHYPAPCSSASGSSSPPPIHLHTRPVNHARRSLPVIEESMGINANKQKQDRLGWMDDNAQGIAQDDDLHPPMTATQNAGRPPISGRPPIQLQVQVGPRPHDVLAQPQSPVSDPEDDVPGAELNRAPTYHPRGQPHPGHARIISERVSRRSTDSSGGLATNGSTDLPAWTAVAPSLEGPAYEEVMRTTTPASRPAPSPAPPPSAPAVASRNERRHSSAQWKPVHARPQAQERVAGARHSMMGAPSLQTSTSQSTYTTSPSTYTASPVTVAAPVPAPAPEPAPAPAPARALPTPAPAPARAPLASFTAPPPGAFDPGAVYRATQSYTLTGRQDFVFRSSVVDAQRELQNSGAHAFYNAAVAPTLSKAPFRAPPPPPPRTSTVDDDRSSVFSGRSGGARQDNVYSGGDMRTGVYPAGAPPAGGIMSGGAALPVPITMPHPSLPMSEATGGYQTVRPGEGTGGYQSGAAAGGYRPGTGAGGGYQPGGYEYGSGVGSQVPGAGGYQSNFQSGAAGGYQPQPMPSGLGAYQPQPSGTYQAQPFGTYQPQPGTFNPQSSGTSYQPPLGGYQPQPSGNYQPQPMTGTYQPQGMGAYQPQQMFSQPGAPMAGQAAPAAAPIQVMQGFIAPSGPPPKRAGKLYKKL